jgi:hypothetical protein
VVDVEADKTPRSIDVTSSKMLSENFQPPRSDNKKRFKTVSEEELRELQERKQSISTKKTKWGVRLFQGDLSYKKIYPTYFNPS